MTTNNIIQMAIFVGVLLLLAKPLGWYMARVLEGKPCGLDRALGPVERLIYRLLGTKPQEEMGWKTYAGALLLFQVASFLAVYLLQRVQGWLPLNPQELPNTSEHLAFNTAVSFTTNTNWQSYGAETTLSYLTQMLGLTVQNFVSAAVGIAVLAGMIRGFARRSVDTIGNFWVDLTRSTLYILLPLSLILALALVSQGVVQNFRPYETIALDEPVVDHRGEVVKIEHMAVKEQVIAMGPAASQVAIKQLGTNGGGFFNVNSAHPLENPTAISNLLEMLSILAISAGLCITFGIMVGDKRQGWALLAAMALVLVALMVAAVCFEQQGNPKLGGEDTVTAMVDQTASTGDKLSDAEAAAGGVHSGGNMEGKEARFGIANSAIWATATTAASNGSVNSMHDSYTPLGGLVPMWLMQLGEVIFGGVGSGLYGMILFAMVAVFISGLMVGRTPEYIGKKLEPYEMKMVSIGILAPVMVVLVGAAWAVATKSMEASLANRGSHGFSEVLYAYSSAGNNNGSAFAGLNANTPFFNFTLGLAMLFARYWVLLPVLAIAGSMARKKYTPPSAGTLPTHGPLFVVLLIGAVITVGALSFIPALALGPIVEHLQLSAGF